MSKVAEEQQDYEAVPWAVASLDELTASVEKLRRTLPKQAEGMSAGMRPLFLDRAIRMLSTVTERLNELHDELAHQRQTVGST
jgi:hypothetical protein